MSVLYVEGGTSAIRSMTATGHAPQNPSRTRPATAPASTRRPVLKLSGNVTVVNATGTLKGPELVLNLAEGTTVFSSQGGGRVTGVFVTE